MMNGIIIDIIRQEVEWGSGFEDGTHGRVVSSASRFQGGDARHPGAYATRPMTIDPRELGRHFVAYEETKYD